MSGAKRCLAATALLSILCATTAAWSADCPKRSLVSTKPALKGQIHDGARKIAFTWRSTAGQPDSSGWWSIDDSICNTGSSAVIVDWPRTGLANDAYTPLYPGSEIHSEFSIGPYEPVSDKVGLRYGKYTSAEAQTEIYRAPSGKRPKRTNLRSKFGGQIFFDNKEHSSGEVIRPDGAQATTFEVEVDAVPEGDKSYRLVAFAKASRPIPLLLGISSKQSKLLLTALNRNGFKPDFFPLEKLTGKSDIERLRGLSVVSFPVSADGKPISLDVPSELSDVEQATAVLIAEGRIALVATISLFQ